MVRFAPCEKILPASLTERQRGRMKAPLVLPLGLDSLKSRVAASERLRTCLILKALTIECLKLCRQTQTVSLWLCSHFNEGFHREHCCGKKQTDSNHSQTGGVSPELVAICHHTARLPADVEAETKTL